MEILNQISALLQRGKAKDVKALVAQAIEEGIPAASILNEGLLAGIKAGILQSLLNKFCLAGI